MIAEGSNAVVVRIADEIGPDGTEVISINKRVRGGNPCEGGEGGTFEAVTDPRWHVEANME